MELKASTLLRRLEKLKTAYGNDAPGQKLELLRPLERRRLQRATEVYRLHEVLCFLHAYPDSKPILHQVEQMLAGFSQRADLIRHRAVESSHPYASNVLPAGKPRRNVPSRR